MSFGFTSATTATIMILHQSARCALSSSTVLKRLGPPIGPYAVAGECQIHRGVFSRSRRENMPKAWSFNGGGQQFFVSREQLSHAGEK
jgi:hypothetical protein